MNVNQTQKSRCIDSESAESFRSEFHTSSQWPRGVLGQNFPKWLVVLSTSLFRLPFWDTLKGPDFQRVGATQHFLLPNHGGKRSLFSLSSIVTGRCFGNRGSALIGVLLTQPLQGVSHGILQHTVGSVLYMNVPAWAAPGTPIVASGGFSSTRPCEI